MSLYQITQRKAEHFQSGQITHNNKNPVRIFFKLFFYFSDECYLPLQVLLSTLLIFIIICTVHNHKLKQVTQLEKFNLKIQALKIHEKKLRQQLQQKKDVGKAEYEVDNESPERPRKLEKSFILSVDCDSCVLVNVTMFGLCVVFRKFSRSTVSRELTQTWMNFK